MIVDSARQAAGENLAALPNLEFLETLDECACVTDAQGRVLGANRHACACWSLSPEAAAGRPILACFPASCLPGDVAGAFPAALAEAAGGAPVDLKAAGEERPALRLRPLRPGAVALYFRCRMRAADDMDAAARREHLRIAMQAAGFGTWETDLVANRRIWSPEVRALCAIPPGAEPSFATFLAAIHPDDHARVIAVHDRALVPGGGDYRVEFRVLDPERGPRWVALHGRVFFAPDGRPLRIAGVTFDIDARRRADAGRHEREELFRHVFEQSPLGKSTATLDGIIRAVNPAFCGMLGCSEQELRGRNVTELLHPEDSGNYLRRRTRLIAGEIDRLHLELRLLRKTGEPVWTSVNLALIHGEGGELLYTLGVFENIDERRRLTEALRERDERLKLAREVAGIGNWEWDLHTDELRWSPEQRHVFGVAPQAEVTPALWESLLHPEERQETVARARQLRMSGQPFTHEYRILRHGEERWILSRGATLCDVAGWPARAIGVTIDITGRKRLEQELRESEQRYRLFAEAARDGVIVHDFETIIDVSGHFAEIFGFRPEEMIGQPVGLLASLIAAEELEATAERARGGHKGMAELTCVRRDGTRFPVEYSGESISYRGRRARLAVMRDITERKRAERVLRELNRRLEHTAEWRARQLDASRARLRAFFDNSPDWLTLQRATPDGNFVYEDINPTCERAYGLSREQVAGRTVADVLGVEPADLPLRHFRECLRTGLPQRYVTRRTLAGRTRTIDVVTVLVPGASEAGDRFLITTARDITEREELEAQLRQAQRMEAVGQLTGGVAHDFNNLLTAIASSLELIRMKTADERLRRLADTALRAAMRGGQLTHQLLAFARRQVLHPTVIDLNVALHEIEPLLRSAVGESVGLRLETAPDLWPCAVDPAQFEAAVMNLVVNARDAMPRGGALVLATANCRLEAEEGQEGLPEGDYVRVEVSDTGEGMPPDVLARVFEPFYTTKEIGKGSGLGLSMVHGFARQSGGTVRISSAPGQGTAAALYLPRSAAAAQEAPREEAAALGASPVSGAILLVEDDPDVRRATGDLLRALGHRVWEAGSAAAALEFLHGARPLDLLLTDLVMPGGLDGVELAREACRVRPGLKVLLTSGRTADPSPGPAEGEAGFPFISKPYRPADLALRLGELLAAP